VIQILEDCVSKKTIGTACDCNHCIVDSTSSCQLVSFVEEGQVQGAGLNESFSGPYQNPESCNALP
jgi:hypothetical protein